MVFWLFHTWHVTYSSALHINSNSWTQTVQSKTQGQTHWLIQGESQFKEGLIKSGQNLNGQTRIQPVQDNSTKPGETKTGCQWGSRRWLIWAWQLSVMNWLSSMLLLFSSGWRNRQTASLHTSDIKTNKHSESPLPLRKKKTTSTNVKSRKHYTERPETCDLLSRRQTTLTTVTLCSSFTGII